MSEQEIKVPDLGGVDEAEVIEVSVAEGDTVEQEDPILTMESDKASVDLPSPFAGKIVKLTVKVGDTIREGDVIGSIESDGDTGSDDEESADEEDDGKEGSENKAETQKAKSKQGKSEQSPSDSDEASDDDAQSSEAKSPGGKSSGGKSEPESKTVKVPSLDGFDKVPVIEINVSEGDEIDAEDPLVTVESDKASMDIPSPFKGKVEKVLVSKGDEISEGDDLIQLLVEGDSEEQGESEDGNGKKEAAASGKGNNESSSKSEDKPSADGKRDDAQKASDADSSGTDDTEADPAGASVHAGPAVRKLAREMGAELSRIKGSGPKSRILKEDVEGYIRQQLKRSQEGGAAASTASGIPAIKLPDFSEFGEVEREAMSRVQVATANNMQRSWLNVPHVTQFEDADITDLEDFRKAQKAAGEEKGIKLTLLAFLLKASAQAMQAYPQFNVALDMDRKEIIRKKYIHIGIAVDTPEGLMVPVIRDVDKKGLWELAAEAQELAAKARDRKLKPAEMKGACFSITSLGGIGGTAFTPIVNAPEVAILGVSRSAMKPVWDGNAFIPRLVLPLSLSYDHRAVNGADAARFATKLSDLLGDIRKLLL